MTRTDHIISDESILEPFSSGHDPNAFTGKISAFIRQQCATWPELRGARASLRDALHKKFFLTDTEVFVQHNPHRYKSSATRVDHAFIQNRPCFLCPHMLYEHQKALPYRREWLVLNNPFPIFLDHLVVSHRRHLPQDITACLRAMAWFVRETGGTYTAFYNGPACGASAPDHLHFQACPAGGIPITRQLATMFSDSAVTPGRTVVSGHDSMVRVCVLDNRTLVLCLGDDEDALCARLTGVLAFLKAAAGTAAEPMINVIIDTQGDLFRGIVFPRKAHRPACYFKKDEGMMLVSPGAVDVGGLVILPRREDFERISADMLLGIFAEVCLDRSVFEHFVS